MSYRGGVHITDINEDHIEVLEKIRDLVSDSSPNIVINGDIIIKEGQKYHPKKNTQQLRNTPGMNSWKTQVKKRDEVCQCCGTFDHLEVHHIMPLSSYQQLGTDVNNGIVLCQNCHREYHKQWKDSESAVTLVKFLREYGRFL